MKIFKLLVLSIVFSSFLTSTSSAQTDTIGVKTIVEKTSKILNDFPAEKIYLHFDKPYYAVADTVWFKAYVTENQNYLSILSKILYVEVINQQDSLIQTLKLPVDKGLANGQIALPKSNYSQGNYHIRAYTQWMLNAANPAYFNKTFYIGEAIDKEVKTHISFKNNSTDKIEKIDARIQFKDANNKPYANKDVSWTVITRGEVAIKGKGKTDLNGFVNVSMSTNQKAEYQIQKGELITTINTSEKDVATNKFSLKNAVISKDVQFFAEGGNLIALAMNKVAFKAIKSDGLGIKSKGIVVDNTGKQVATFTDQHLGMGSFNFIPETGKTYTANVTFSDGDTQSYKLPAVKDEGINLTVDNSNADNLLIKIIANDAYFEKNKGQKLFIVAQSLGVVCYGAQSNFTAKEFSTTIPKNKFPNGITQITLFKENGTILSERLAFIRQNTFLNINVTSPLATYGPKKKVKINLLTKQDNQPVIGNLSVSVVDETKVPFNDEGASTILTGLLLNSDLKGYVERPNYYFINPDAKKNSDLDLLMITQGYRSYNYADILADKKPTISFLPEQGIEISGILRLNNGIPVRKGQLLLTIPDKRFNLEGTTDPVGNFKFQNLVFNDSSKVTITAKYNPNYKSMTLSLNGVPTPSLTQNFGVADEILNIDSTLTAYLDNSKKQYSFLRTLKEVTIQAKTAPKPSHKDYPALTGLSAVADHEIAGDRLQGCNILTECIKTMMAGVTFFENNFYVSRDYNQGRKVPMGIFVNGMMLDYNALLSVNPTEIESIQIFLKDELGLVNRMNQTNGVIVINLKKQPKGQKISKSELLDMLPKNYEITLSPQGYNKEKQFYSPKYEVAASLNKSDLRTTIYWNPKIVTDSTGNSTIEFYNADGKGQYKVTVEGIDAEGNIGRTVFRYLVK